MTEFHVKYKVSILLNTDVTMVTWRDLVPQTVDFQNISPICPHIRVKICKTVPLANKMTKNKVYSKALGVMHTSGWPNPVKSLTPCQI